MDMTVGRELFWQIEPQEVFSWLRWAAVVVFGLGWLRLLVWVRSGRQAGELPTVRLGWVRALAEAALHSRFKPGVAARIWHVLVFYGFLSLLVVTLCVMASHAGMSFLFRGKIYLGLTLLAEVAGAGLLAGALLALADSLRRPREGRRKFEKVSALLLLIFICLSGFLVEAERIALAADPWRGWSFVGNFLSHLLATSGVAVSMGFYETLWWLHAVVSLCFVAWIPFSTGLRHLLFAPARRADTALRPVSQPPQADLNAVRLAEPGLEPVRLGMRASRDLTPRQRVSLLACMDCGRCERLCPAFQTGQPLSPRKAIRDLAGSSGPQSLLRRVGLGIDRSEVSPAEAVSRSALWACRLCRACEETCPAGVEHVPLVLDMRRAEVLCQGRLPEAAAQALRNLARTGNPYGAPPAERLRWLKDEGIPEKPVGGQSSWLLWIGCLASGDDLKLRVISAWVSLLRKAGVSFYVLREQASCCGEPARVLGDEDLFQTVAKSRIRSLAQAGAEKILVHCPHCYSILRDAYPALGADFLVVHTSAFFRQALQEGLLRVSPEEQGKSGPGRVAYHAPCFLGRYQGLYDPPREILAAVSGVYPLEAARHRKGSFCCGGGGGHFFMDLDAGERPASRRLEELLGLGAEVLSVSCGFCHAMFDDAARRLAEAPPARIADWLELLQERTVPGSAGKALLAG